VKRSNHLSYRPLEPFQLYAKNRSGSNPFT
jgi:hypothetical protein